MHSVFSVAAFAAVAAAIPLYVTDVQVVTEVDVVTVYATEGTLSTVAPAAPTDKAAQHFGHHGGWSRTSEAAAPTTSAWVAPTTSAWVAPTSTETTSSAEPAPTTETSSSVETSSWVAPTTQAWTWAAPTTDAPSTEAAAPTTTSVAWSAPVAPAAPAPSSYSTITDYAGIAVLHHNLHRANHSSPDVAWDASLASTAAKIAAKCVYAHDTSVDGGGYGQNIAAGVEGKDIGSIISDMFYNGEVNYFNGLYGKAQPDMSDFEHWGHFSQIVWKDTTTIGCATQHCPNGLGNTGDGVSPYFTVCNYKGAGNYANEYGDNIGQSLKKATIFGNISLAVTF